MISFQSILNSVHAVIKKASAKPVAKNENGTVKKHAKKSKSSKKVKRYSTIINKVVNFEYLFLSKTKVEASKASVCITAMPPLALTQIEKANLAASQITYNATENSPHLPTGLSTTKEQRKLKIGVQVNASLLPLPLGIVTLLDICKDSISPFPTENKL